MSLLFLQRRGTPYTREITTSVLKDKPGADGMARRSPYPAGNRSYNRWPRLACGNKDPVEIFKCGLPQTRHGAKVVARLIRPVPPALRDLRPTLHELKAE